MRKYLLILLGLLIFTCSDDSPSTDPSGDNTDNNGDNGGNNNETPEIEITGQWDITETRSIADYFEKRKNNNIKSVVSTNNSLDVGVVSIDAPITGEFTATETITVTIGNFGTEEASNFDLLYKIAYGDEDYGDDITETFSGTIASEATAQYSFTTTADLSQLGQWHIFADTEMESDEDTENDVFQTHVNNLNYSSICNVHSIIFEEDGSYSLYTNNEEGICNYVIFGTYDLDEEESTVTLYVEYEDNTPIVLGTIEDVQVENGEFSGTINFDDLCVQVVDGYEEDDYTEALTYLPDDNLEQWLVDNGYDNQMDDYMITSNAVNQSTIAIGADDACYDEDGNIICAWEEYMNYDTRFTNRLTSLAGIEAFPSLSLLNLTGNDLDSINITENSQLKYLFLNFNSFYKIDTSGNPNLVTISLDNNKIIPELDFSQNTVMKHIALPNIALGGMSGYIGPGGYFDLSNLIHLEGLSLGNNNLTSVDVSNNNNLLQLKIGGNNISEIDISNLVSLEEFSIESSPITSIDLSANTQLYELSVSSCNLEGTLDISMIENLMKFSAWGNPNLTCIKVSQAQLDNINNPPPELDWNYSGLVTVSVDCD